MRAEDFMDDVQFRVSPSLRQNYDEHMQRNMLTFISKDL